MRTKEQILEVLEEYSQVLDDYGERGVTSWDYGDIADDLLKLQEAVPEGAIPEGYITEECPPGYVAKESLGCHGCALSTGNRTCGDTHVLCAREERKDRKPVIFIRKEDAK